MDYFGRLQHLLRVEKEEDRRTYKSLTAALSVAQRREAGMTWYPVAIKDTELGRADYLTVELERTTHHHLVHQLRFGSTAALFSNHDAGTDRIEGVISHISGNTLRLTLRTEALPDWSRNGKLGIDAVFDEASYAEMETALKAAAVLASSDGPPTLIEVLTGSKTPTFHPSAEAPFYTALNASQQKAVAAILAANELAIVHGPPGTGKTTTLVQAIKALVTQQHRQVLVVAPSNAAVDLLTEKLFDEGLPVLRVGNPARVSERLMALTLDAKVAAHSSSKEVKRLRKQASEYRGMAQKYKRSFGPAEREQRNALFAEARNIAKEIERIEGYVVADTLAKAAVITATLVGANHYTIRQAKFGTVVIDEAAQALEPACWIPILKAGKVVMAGDHHQLPPTIKSAEAAPELSLTLMQKLVGLYPEAVVLLEEQYRMNTAIAGFSSNAFYEGRLTAHASVAHHTLFPGDAPLLFIDTAGCGFEEAREGSGLSNPEEALFLLKQLAALVQQLNAFYGADVFPSIGVISPYRQQVNGLKEKLASFPALVALGSAITINTIDSFQGGERDVIFISLTRSNAEATIGFLSEVRRLNVALTRARKKLVVVGDSATLSGFAFYAGFIAYAQEHDAYKSAWELMEW